MIFRKHQYTTEDLENPSVEMDSESETSSQDVFHGSFVSQASSGVDNPEAEVSVDCRVCKEPIFLDCVQDYFACTQPSGRAHYPAHFVCLGFYTRGPIERKSIRASYRCPRHIDY
jgi:hypothetical protein